MQGTGTTTPSRSRIPHCHAAAQYTSAAVRCAASCCSAGTLSCHGALFLSLHARGAAVVPPQGGLTVAKLGKEEPLDKPPALPSGAVSADWQDGSLPVTLVPFSRSQWSGKQSLLRVGQDATALNEERRSSTSRYASLKNFICILASCSLG